MERTRGPVQELERDALQQLAGAALDQHPEVGAHVQFLAHGRVRACRRRGKPLVVRKDLVVTGGKARVAGPYHVCRDRDVSLGPAVSTVSGAI